MCMPGNHRIDPVNRRQGDACVFHLVMGVAVAEPRVAQRHDNIRALGAQSGHPDIGSLEDIAGGDAAVQVLTFPDFNLRRQKADDADPDLGATTPV